MKNYRNAVAAFLLAFVLATSALANDGIMHTDRTPPPPPPVQADGVIWTDIAAPVPDGDVMTEIALSLLQNLVTLL
jgi:hypothetical protein